MITVSTDPTIFEEIEQKNIAEIPRNICEIYVKITYNEWIHTLRAYAGLEPDDDTQDDALKEKNKVEQDKVSNRMKSIQAEYKIKKLKYLPHLINARNAIYFNLSELKDFFVKQKTQLKEAVSKEQQKVEEIDTNINQQSTPSNETIMQNLFDGYPSLIVSSGYKTIKKLHRDDNHNICSELSIPINNGGFFACDENEAQLPQQLCQTEAFIITKAQVIYSAGRIVAVYLAKLPSEKDIEKAAEKLKQETTDRLQQLEEQRKINIEIAAKTNNDGDKEKNVSEPKDLLGYDPDEVVPDDTNTQAISVKYETDDDSSTPEPMTSANLSKESDDMNRIDEFILDISEVQLPLSGIEDNEEEFHSDSIAASLTRMMTTNSDDENEHKSTESRKRLKSLSSISKDSGDDSLIEPIAKRICTSTAINSSSKLCSTSNNDLITSDANESGQCANETKPNQWKPVASIRPSIVQSMKKVHDTKKFIERICKQMVIDATCGDKLDNYKVFLIGDESIWAGDLKTLRERLLTHDGLLNVARRCDCIRESCESKSGLCPVCNIRVESRIRLAAFNSHGNCTSREPGCQNDNMPLHHTEVLTMNICKDCCKLLTRNWRAINERVSFIDVVIVYFKVQHTLIKDRNPNADYTSDAHVEKVIEQMLAEKALENALESFSRIMFV